MPAVPVALAELERRVGEIRRRLNRQAVIEVLCPGIGAALCVLAGLVALAVRASPDAFQGIAYATAAALALIAAATAWALRRRLLSLDQTARVADRRAGMQERLTTALWLRRVAHPSSLASLLLADTFDRATHWRPEAIAPRRLPLASLALPVIGAVALAATFFLLRRTPPPPAQPAQVARLEPGDRTAPLPRASHEHRALPGIPDPQGRANGRERDARATIDGRSGTGAQGDGAQSRDAGQQAAGGGPRSGLGSGTRKSAGGRQTAEHSLSGGLQDMIREALGVEPTDQAQRLEDARGRNPSAGRADRPDRNDGDQHGDKGQSATEQAAKKADGTAGRKGETSALARASGRSGKSVESGARRHAAGELSKEKTGAPRSGQPAHAGQGSSPDTLFAPPAAGGGSGGNHATAQAAKPKSFKLTLSSFLSGGDEESSPKHGSELGGGPGEHTGAARALNPSQNGDDAMRRAEIPPEYEDIIRRLYSARSGR